MFPFFSTIILGLLDFFHCLLNRRWQLLSTFKIDGCLVAVQLYCKVVADPDLQIGGGVGHPDPEISGGGD